MQRETSPPATRRTRRYAKIRGVLTSRSSCRRMERMYAFYGFSGLKRRVAYADECLAHTDKCSASRRVLILLTYSICQAEYLVQMRSQTKTRASRHRSSVGTGVSSIAYLSSRQSGVVLTPTPIRNSNGSETKSGSFHPRSVCVFLMTFLAVT